MKIVSETSGIERLAKIRSAFSAEIRERYEHKAKRCSACESPGICCRDEHFVNVHITKLEAVAIQRELEKLDDEARIRVYERLGEAIERYNLDGPGDSFRKTYACPLFERGTGCLVHATAKPLPCIAHACYKKREDIPPEHLLENAERAVMRLNQMVYGKESLQTPIPVAIGKLI